MKNKKYGLLFFGCLSFNLLLDVKHHFIVLQISSPTAYNARGFVSGQMFNRKGEVWNYHPKTFYIHPNITKRRFGIGSSQMIQMGWAGWKSPEMYSNILNHLNQFIKKRLIVIIVSDLFHPFKKTTLFDTLRFWCQKKSTFWRHISPCESMLTLYLYVCIQLVASITQQGLIRKIRTPSSPAVSKL